jgi:DNA-binding GntR family transcriptional regulator
MERVERQRSKLTNDTYRHLVDAMVDGTLEPGDRLVQDQLAERLDVSRTPIRDALMRLHSEGVITPTGRRGYVVRQLSPQDVRDNYDARMAIESFAAMRVTEMGEPALSTVRTALDHACAQNVSTAQRSFSANRTLHEAIVRATGNAQLLACFESVWGRALSALIYRNFYIAQTADEFVRSHSALVEVLGEGEPERSRLAMLAHINDGIAHTPASDST